MQITKIFENVPKLLDTILLIFQRLMLIKVAKGEPYY